MHLDRIKYHVADLAFFVRTNTGKPGRNCRKRGKGGGGGGEVETETFHGSD